MVLRTDKILWSNISENWIIKITFTFARISTLHMSKAAFYKVINISWSLDGNVGGMSLKSGCLWELFCHINWSISRVSSPCIISLHITQTRQEIISFMCFQLPCKDTPVYHHNHKPASQQTERMREENHDKIAIVTSICGQNRNNNNSLTHASILFTNPWPPWPCNVRCTRCLHDTAWRSVFSWP